MKHDVEAKTECHDEERVPEQEGEEGLEDLDGNGGRFEFRKILCFFYWRIIGGPGWKWPV